MICDISGKELFVMYVFFKVIKYMYDYFLNKFKEEYNGEELKEEINWVLIVLVIWDDSVKQFMRDVVKQVYMDIVNKYIYVISI